MWSLLAMCGFEHLKCDCSEFRWAKVLKKKKSSGFQWFGMRERLELSQ